MVLNTAGYVQKSEGMMIERICLNVFVKDLNLFAQRIIPILMPQQLTKEDTLASLE